MPSRGQIHSGGSIDTGPATTAVTKPSSIDRLVAAAPVLTCSHRSSLSSGMATAVIGGGAGRRPRPPLQPPPLSPPPAPPPSFPPNLWLFFFFFLHHPHTPPPPPTPIPRL